MQSDNPILIEDLKNVCENNEAVFRQLDSCTILITGASGLIGQTLVRALIYWGNYSENPPKVLAAVRNQHKAEMIFKGELEAAGERLEIVEIDVTKPFAIDRDVNYVIHAASETSSRAFIEHPIEVIETNVIGTENVLEFSKEKGVSGVVLLSSMEVYGYPERGHSVREDECGNLSSLVPRNSYPISKQVSESLCRAYAEEFNVPAKVIRLTQTFGPGIRYDDGRVFAEFARCIIEKKDIVLKTKGETERSYLYTADAVAAILTVLVKGEIGGTYNAANEETYCSIAQMAQLAAKEGGINVKFEIQDTAALGYADTLYMDLNCDKLKKTGWKPTVDLKDMFYRMIACMSDF